MAKKIRQFDLARLSAGLPPGVTPTFGGFTAEAAAVVLEHNKHLSGTGMKVAAGRSCDSVVLWPPLHPDAVRSHKDLPAAAEQGAYGIAFLLAEEFTDFVVIERSSKGTGFDYYLGRGSEYPFQQAARLEVSGIVSAPAAVDARVKAKMKQTDRSKGTLPAYVAVVEFGQPKSVFKKRK